MSTTTDAPRSESRLTFDISIGGGVARGSRGRTSFFGAVFILCNTCLGAATLNIPACFNQAGGVVPGLVMMGVSGALCYVTLFICGYVTTRVCEGDKLSEMHQFAHHLVGRHFRVFNQIVLCVKSVGTTSAYVVIIGDQLEDIVPLMVGNESYCAHWWLQRQFLSSLVAILVIFPLCLIKTVDYLKYPSYLTVAAILYITFDVFARFFTRSDEVEFDSELTASGFISSFPTVLLGFLCHYNATIVYCNLEKRELDQWARVSATTTVFCALIYTTVGLFGYLTFGSSVRSDVLQSYPEDAPDVVVARVMILLAVTMSYPIVLFPTRNAADDALVQGWAVASTALRCDGGAVLLERRKRMTAETVAWVATTILVGLFVPTLGTITDFAGSLAAVFLLVTPGLMLFMTAMRDLDAHKWERVAPSELLLVLLGGSLVALGGFICAQGLTTAALATSDTTTGFCSKL